MNLLVKEFVDLIKLLLLYLSLFGISDIFINYMKFTHFQKLIFYLVLGIFGITIFINTIPNHNDNIMILVVK